MATVYSNTFTSGYNDIRIKVDYSGTSATCTVQFKRNGSYGSYGWKDPNATLEFNGSTKSAGYSDPGYVRDHWVDLKTVSGYSVSTSGGTYSWKFNKGAGAVLSGSGTVTVPAQSTPPATPTISAVLNADETVSVTWGTTNLGNPTGTVKLYGDTNADPSTELDSKSTTGNTTFTHTGLNPGTTYYYKAYASNSVGSGTSSIVSVTIPEHAKLYGSVNGGTKRIKKLYGSVNGQTKTIKKVYASVNGQTKLIYRG